MKKEHFPYYNELANLMNLSFLYSLSSVFEELEIEPMRDQSMFYTSSVLKFLKLRYIAIKGFLIIYIKDLKLFSNIVIQIVLGVMTFILLLSAACANDKG